LTKEYNKSATKEYIGNKKKNFYIKTLSLHIEFDRNECEKIEKKENLDLYY